MFFWDGMLRSRAARSQHLLVGPWTHGGVFRPTQTQRDVDYTPPEKRDGPEKITGPPAKRPKKPRRGA